MVVVVDPTTAASAAADESRAKASVSSSSAQQSSASRSKSTAEASGSAASVRSEERAEVSTPASAKNKRVRRQRGPNENVKEEKKGVEVSFDEHSMLVKFFELVTFNASCVLCSGRRRAATSQEEEEAKGSSTEERRFARQGRRSIASRLGRHRPRRADVLSVWAGVLRRDDWLRQRLVPDRVVPLQLRATRSQTKGKVVLSEVSWWQGQYTSTGSQVTKARVTSRYVTHRFNQHVCSPTHTTVLIVFIKVWIISEESFNSENCLEAALRGEEWLALL